MRANSGRRAFLAPRWRARRVGAPFAPGILIALAAVMSAIRRILCPVDFSEFSAHALEMSAALAARHLAEVMAVHVSPPSLPPMAAFPEVPAVVTMTPAIRQRLQAELDRFVSPAREKGTCVATVVEDGAIVTAIVRQAELWEADLIVMGTHGVSGFERWILGSVTEKVLRKAPCPVLTVSGPPESAAAETARFRGILCALDLADSSRWTLEHAASMAEEGAAHLTLLHVLENMPVAESTVVRAGLDLEAYRAGRCREAQEGLRALALEVAPDGSVDTVVAAGTPYREILRVARERASELVVVGVHGRRGLDLFHLGSTAHHVVRGAGVPVLTVRERRRAGGS
jgi:nucleotide-binding universal stress UspA family protein